MRHRTAALTPALDATLEALTLGGTDDVDLLDISEISDGDDLADLVLLAVLDADLTKEADRLPAIGLFTFLALMSPKPICTAS